MRRLSILLTVGLVGYTALAIVFYDTFPSLGVIQVAGTQAQPFDLVFYPAVVVLAIGMVRHQIAPFTKPTRLTGYIVAAYAAYQILLVLPMVVISKGYSPLGAFYALRPRLSMILVMFFAVLVTHYWNGDVVSKILEWAALALVAFAVWRFLTGTQVEVEFGTGRFRVMWGGSSLLFGWLVISRLLRERLRARDAGLAVVGLTGIVLVNHRSAYVALAAAVLAYILARTQQAVRTIGILVGIVMFGVLVVLTFFPQVERSLQYSFDTALNPNADANTIDRIEKTSLSFQTFEKNPFGDILWRSRGSYYPVHLGSREWAPHDFVAQLLAGEGLIGFSAWIAVLLIALVVAFRNARQDPRSATLGAYLLFYLVFCLFNTNFYMSENVVLLAATIGLILWSDRVAYVQAYLVPGLLKPKPKGRPQGAGDLSVAAIDFTEVDVIMQRERGTA